MLPGANALPRQVRLPHVAAAVIVLGVLLLMPLGVQTRAREALADMVHAPAFGLLAVLIASWLIRRREAASVGDENARPSGWSPIQICFAVGVGVSLFGAVSEVLQGLVGRGRSLHDAISNCLGAAAFLAAYLAIREQRPKPLARWAALGVIAMSLAWLSPLAVLGDVWRQRRETPRLAGFERISELDRWILHHADLSRVGEHASEGAWAGEIQLEPGRFAGVVLRMADLDWSGYAALEYDIYVPEELNTPLSMKVVDRHYNGKLEDRYDERLELRPGANQVRIPLAEVVAGPQGPPLDLTRIWWLEFYQLDSTRPTRLLLDNLRLTGPGPSRK
jgi:hypothetical protein